MELGIRTDIVLEDYLNEYIVKLPKKFKDVVSELTLFPQYRERVFTY